jgi:hypothetical protein
LTPAMVGHAVLVLRNNSPAAPPLFQAAFMRPGRDTLR